MQNRKIAAQKSRCKELLLFGGYTNEMAELSSSPLEVRFNGVPLRGYRFGPDSACVRGFLATADDAADFFMHLRDGILDYLSHLNMMYRGRPLARTKKTMILGDGSWASGLYFQFIDILGCNTQAFCHMSLSIKFQRSSTWSTR